MKVTKIVSNNKWFNNFYCRNCKIGTNIIYKLDMKKDVTYCGNCLPKTIKESDITTINQNGEVL